VHSFFPFTSGNIFEVKCVLKSFIVVCLPMESKICCLWKHEVCIVNTRLSWSCYSDILTLHVCPAESEQSLMKMIITPCSWVLDRCNTYTYCQCNGPKSPGYESGTLSSVLCLSELSVMGLFDCWCR
jgi:hypothetical protein